MQYGDKPCRQANSPTTTADTTAELGCKALQNETLCMCRLIRPAADLGDAIPALPEPCCHHGAQVGSLPDSLDGSHAAPSKRLSTLLTIWSTSDFFSGIPAVLWLANPQLLQMQKDTERGCASRCTVILFVSFKFSGYSIHGCFQPHILDAAQRI